MSLWLWGGAALITLAALLQFVPAARVPHLEPRLRAWQIALLIGGVLLLGLETLAAPWSWMFKIVVAVPVAASLVVLGGVLRRLPWSSKQPR